MILVDTYYILKCIEMADVTNEIKERSWVGVNRIGWTLCDTKTKQIYLLGAQYEEICVNSFNIDKVIKVNSIMKTKLWWVLSKLIYVQYQHFPGKPPFIWKRVFPGSWYLLQMLFAFFQWSDSLCLWQSSHRLFSNLESLLFSELRPTKTNLILNDVYLNAAIVPNQSWSRLEQGHFWPIGVFLGASFPFFQVFQFHFPVLILLTFAHIAHPSVRITFPRLTAPSSAPHLHNKVDFPTMRWQRKFGSCLVEIFASLRAHFANVCL